MTLPSDQTQKVRARYDAAPALSATLEQLVENEKGEKKRTATEGLMWLLRGLSFTCKALQNSQANKTEELSAAFTSAYDTSLKKFHGILIRPIFSVSYFASPCFFFSIFIPSLSRLNEVDGQEEGSEPRPIHIRGSAATFFSLISGCRVFDVADAILLYWI